MVAQTPAWKKLVDKVRKARQGLARAGSEADGLLASDSLDCVGFHAALLKEIEAWPELLDELGQKAEALKATLARRREEQIDGFGDRLNRRLGESGHTVSGHGTQLLVDGCVHVEVQAEQARVRINDYSAHPMVIDDAAQAIAAEAETLRKGGVEPVRLLRELREAYGEEIAARGREPGSQVETAKLLLRIALARQTARFRADPGTSNYRGYDLRQFRADLYRLLAEGPTDLKGEYLHYSSGATTAGGIFMLVPALGRGAYVGRIWFATSEGRE